MNCQTKIKSEMAIATQGNKSSPILIPPPQKKDLGNV